MDLFHVIDDAHAILRSKGVYRQVPIFRRGDEMFAKWGSGFIRLLSSGHTTQPNVSWVELDISKVSYISTSAGLRIVESSVNVAPANEDTKPLAKGA